MTGSEEGEVAVIRINSGKVLKTIQDHRGAPVTDLTVAIVPLKVIHLFCSMLLLLLSCYCVKICICGAAVIRGGG